MHYLTDNQPLCQKKSLICGIIRILNERGVLVDTYRTIHDYGTDQVTIEKSLFIGYAKPVESEEEARAFIAEISTKHKDATHNVWAYVIGQNMNIQRYSDDGEPQGTAGIPTLEVIKKEGLCNVVVVGTRYFGGIKLGVSGLITAYKTTAQLTLQEAEIEERTIDLTYKIVFDYKDMNKVMKIIKDRNLTIVSQTLELNCTLLVEVRKAEASYVEQLFEQLYEVTITPIEG